jgi:hypothetical protein
MDELKTKLKARGGKPGLVGSIFGSRKIFSTFSFLKKKFEENFFRNMDSNFFKKFQVFGFLKK